MLSQIIFLFLPLVLREVYSLLGTMLQMSKSLTHNNFLTHATINSDPNANPWYFTGIYCPCTPIGKSIFWDHLNSIAEDILGPWLLMGDFNSITSQVEKRGGRPFASSSSHSLSNELDNLGVIDLGFHGNPFIGAIKGVEQ